jgi:hypothetical protein
MWLHGDSVVCSRRTRSRVGLAMTTSSDAALHTLQREVQRLLGRYLLRLQQYECPAKGIIAHHEMTGPAHAVETVRVARVAATARKTLGMLVGELLGSYIVADTNNNFAEATTNLPEDVASFRFRMTLSLSDADLARTKVKLQNS